MGIIARTCWYIFVIYRYPFVTLLCEQYDSLITVMYGLQNLNTFAIRFQTSEFSFIYYSRREYHGYASDPYIIMKIPYIIQLAWLSW